MSIEARNEKQIQGSTKRKGEEGSVESGECETQSESKKESEERIEYLRDEKGEGKRES